VESRKYPKTLVHPIHRSVTVNSIMDEEQWVSAGYAPIKVTKYSEFPKVLNHPDHEPTRMVSAETHGAAVSPDCPWRATARLASYVPAVWEPERYPPVTVHSPQEEALFIAKGYAVTGTSDKAAFSSAVASSLCPREVSEFHEHPKWVTGPDGAAVLVKTAAEESALLVTAETGGLESNMTVNTRTV
jgi:hypothetical protein